METVPVVINPLGGIDQRWVAGPRQAERVRDMTWDGPKGAWTTSGGFRRIILGPLDQQGDPLNPFTGVGEITSLFHFTQHSGAIGWIIYEAANGNLYQFNPSTAARSASPGDIAKDRSGTQQTNRAVLTTPWQGSQACTFGDSFYLVNGINRPLVFTGYYWDYAGFSAPAGTPTATAMAHPHATTTGNLATPQKLAFAGLGPTSETPGTDYRCAYRYRIQYVNNRGILSPPSAPSELVTFTNAGGVTSASQGASFISLSLPLGNASVVGRVVWRTQNCNDSNGDPVNGYADQYFFHSTLLDNCTVSIMDGLLDSELGETLNANAYGPWPVATKYVAAFKGTMFAAGVSEAQVYFSAPLEPENFPFDNVIDLGDASLGSITGLYPTRNALVVFKQRGIQLIKGDPVNGFSPIILTRDVGCAAPNTVKDVPGVGLCFLSEFGVFAMQGALENEGFPTRVLPIHVPIGDIVRSMNTAALIGACGEVYHAGKEYWLNIPTLGSARNNLSLIFHYEPQGGEWSTRENFPAQRMVETNDHAGTLLFASWDAVNAEGIMVYSRGFPDKGGVWAIEPLYQTDWIDAGGVWRSVVPKGVELRCGLHGNNTVEMTVTTNRRLDNWPTSVEPMAAQYPEDEQPVWGTAAYDEGTLWQDLRPGTLRWDINAPQMASVHETSLTFEATGHWLTVQAIALELSATGATPWKPITSQTKAGR